VCGVTGLQRKYIAGWFYLRQSILVVEMRLLRTMCICVKHKYMNGYLYRFYKNCRQISTKNSYTRNKMGAVTYITCQEDLKIRGYKRYSNMCSIADTNVPHSQVKHISCITSAKFHGQYRTSNINVSLPLSYNIMGNRSFSSGKHTSEFNRNNGGMDDADQQDDEPEDFEKEEYDDMVKRVLHLPEMGHQVLVVQPYVKWGSGKKHNTTPELQLAEAVALIGTLPKWKVVDTVS